MLPWANVRPAHFELGEAFSNDGTMEIWSWTRNGMEWEALHALALLSSIDFMNTSMQGF